MKAVFVLAVLCGFIALSLCEDCNPMHHCSHVSCPENEWTQACDHGECTCIHTKGCISVQDCNHLDECNDEKHCVDGKCACGKFPVRPGGPGFGNHGN